MSACAKKKKEQPSPPKEKTPGISTILSFWYFHEVPINGAMEDIIIKLQMIECEFINTIFH